MNKKLILSLHDVVGTYIENNFNTGNITVLKNYDCGGNQRLPLFVNNIKSPETETCNADMIFIKNVDEQKTVRVIVEIEESDIKPSKLCGKFMAAVLAKNYIHELHCNHTVPVDDEATFVQIIDTSKLTRESNKLEQFRNIEKAIQGMLPLSGSNIKNYKLFYLDLHKDRNDLKEEMHNIKTYIYQHI